MKIDCSVHILETAVRQRGEGWGHTTVRNGH